MFDTDRTPDLKSPYAVWLGLGPQAVGAYEGREGELTAQIEQLGFGALWLGGSWGADLAPVERMLAGTPGLVVGTSIANIWRDPAEAVAASYRKVADRFGDRFVLGLGVGHHPQTEFNQGQYDKPLAKLRAYLDVLDEGGVPARNRALAALGPKALELARDRSAGALPYLTTPEHTRTARAALGPDRLLVPEQKVVLSSDPDEARGLARGVLKPYLGLPNYVNSWLRLGFTEADVENGGSDRLIDGLFGWGPDALMRVRAHREAGADQVCVQPVPAPGRHALDDLRVIARELF
ncbi:LLM class F420-dependent oxidoreductase [Kineosporia succinea]|uniref:F420-dependent oxidoreductase n=1 Tax=Kineosporia succinea TaxID=84632 RepID=A0ABT9P4I2_9ACTN|nr:LLM class F420-dependent oxidoreductase [Kineosporia succinea]MDP9827100.1 putative F420-dependent oxidoreductase [Kineosporia succinea]